MWTCTWFYVFAQLERSSSLIISEDYEVDEREEIQAIGAVQLSVYSSYFKAVNSFTYLVFIVVMFICAQGLVSGVDVYISLW